jgi:hypothetical protein
VTVDQNEICPGTIATATPGAGIPDGATLNWTVNGEAVSQAPTFQFGTAERQPGSYRIGLKVSAPGFNDASADTTVGILANTPPTGTVQASPAEIWVGEKSTLTANFSPGRCGGQLAPATFTASEGSVNRNEFDSTGVQFDPSNNSEQRKTVTITASTSNATGSGKAEATVVVKKRGAVVSKRLPDVIFPTGNARVNNCGKRVLLESLKSLMDSDPTATVVLVGHQSEAEAKSKGLDQKRALNAAAVISASQGICLSIPAKQIQVSATGTESNGVDFQPNFCGTSAGAERSGQAIRESDETAKYRRVEVWFVPTGGKPPDSLRDAKDATTLPVSSLGCPK